VSNAPQNPTHLFISYASEDIVLATWLARKLAALGYAVWFDRMEMLGGEPWPQTIDDAIKNRTFRMLALISQHSLRKQKPTGERALAQKIAEDRSIPDFLIPLKIDDAELDWLTAPTSYISFTSGWAGGFRHLLAKLSKIDAPKTLSNGSALAALSFPTGNDLIMTNSEDLCANVKRVRQLPLALKLFTLTNTMDEDDRNILEARWAHYRITPREALAFASPLEDFASRVTETKQGWSWMDYDTVRGIRTRDIVANLIVRAIRARLINAGCCTHPERKQTIFLPENFTRDGWLRFTGWDGAPARLKIRGKATLRQFRKPPETNFHHFAFRLRLGRGLDQYFWIQITPFFFDEEGNAITDKRVGPRRKRVCRSWFNDKWLNRLLAVEKILNDLQATAIDGITLETLHVLQSPIALNESALAQHEAVSEDTDAEYVLEDEAESEDTDE
jgi:hypothetical protein